MSQEISNFLWGLKTYMEAVSIENEVNILGKEIHNDRKEEDHTSPQREINLFKDKSKWKDYTLQTKIRCSICDGSHRAFECPYGNNLIALVSEVLHTIGTPPG